MTEKLWVKTHISPPEFSLIFFNFPINFPINRFSTSFTHYPNWHPILFPQIKVFPSNLPCRNQHLIFKPTFFQQNIFSSPRVCQLLSGKFVEKFRFASIHAGWHSKGPWILNSHFVPSLFRIHTLFHLCSHSDFVQSENRMSFLPSCNLRLLCSLGGRFTASNWYKIVLLVT